MSEADLWREIEIVRRRQDYLEALDPNPTLSELSASFLGLLGLRGLWLAGDEDETGAVYDVSGQARKLTFNGNPVSALYNALVPYYAYDGAGDFHSRADENGLDVLGTETYIASSLRGLTLGGWFWTDTVAAGTAHMISKYSGGTQNSYLLYRSGSTFNFSVSNTGAALAGTVTSATIAISQWYFVVGRYTPSTQTLISVNNVPVGNTTSIPASIFNSTSQLCIGANTGGTEAWTGRWVLGFLCAAALPDALLSVLFARTRGLFGV